ncbi:MAG: hypothetical protein A2Y40_09205 [Candidatus Margulisbacteria bacterium GWF2_35_9]|nr:MAG: hypothetical protein A2Y40_09205 [Candidatus Margulisbacteria bacterium GWF2_35_9]
MGILLIKDEQWRKIMDIVESIKAIRAELPGEETYGVCSLGIDYPTWINMMIKRYIESQQCEEDCISLIKDLLCAEADCEAQIYLAKEYGYIKNKKIYSEIFTVRKKLIVLGKELNLIEACR